MLLSIKYNKIRIGLDPLFQAPHNWPAHKKYELGDSLIENNKFSIIFD